MTVLLYIIVSLIVMSLLSLSGVFTLSLSTQKLNRILIFIVSLSAGTLMGSAFFHLLPEAAETFDVEGMLEIVLVAFVIFFLIEKLLFWHHCHRGDCDTATHGQMNLAGDSVHNFLDGLIIAAAFITSVPLGIATTAAVALHEIPQEIGDFGVLLHSGYSRKKALLANILVTLPALGGGILGYFWTTANTLLIPYILAFAAGGFLYIATSDLLPEIRQEVDQKRSWISFFVFLIGVLIMFATRSLG